MSTLDKLIAELCPDGVEYKTLAELGKFYGGITGKSKDDFKDGNAVFISYKMSMLILPLISNQRIE